MPRNEVGLSNDYWPDMPDIGGGERFHAMKGGSHWPASRRGGVDVVAIRASLCCTTPTTMQRDELGRGLDATLMDGLRGGLPGFGGAGASCLSARYVHIEQARTEQAPDPVCRPDQLAASFDLPAGKYLQTIAFAVMDPLTIATAVMPLFQTVYLTCRFLYRQVLVAKGFRSGKANMARSYRFQIVRLKTFWAMLTREIGTVTNVNSLTSLPKVCAQYLINHLPAAWVKAPLTVEKEILELVGSALLDISAVLNTYSSVARQMDEEYTKYSPEKALFPADASKPLLELPIDLDDAAGLTDGELNAEKPSADGPPVAKPKPEAATSGLLARFFNKPQDEKQTYNAQFKWKEIPQAFSWCFDQRRLQKFLDVLSGKIDNLEGFGPYLVASLDPNSTIRRKLENPGSTRAFRDYHGHLLLQEKANSVNTNPKGK